MPAKVRRHNYRTSLLSIRRRPVIRSCRALNELVSRTRRLPKTALYFSYCRVHIPLEDALAMLAPDTVKPNAIRRSP